MTENDRQTEEKIFDAATVVFEEKGMDGARMQDIADTAGINKALLHYYFRTKERLFDAVFQKVAGKMFSKFAPLFQEDMTLEEKIRFFYREHITFLQENRKLPAFVLNEINRNPAIIKKMLKNVELDKIWRTLTEQNQKELEKYDIREEDIPQILTSIISLSVFPFAARGVLESLLENVGTTFDDYIEARKEFAAEFILSALRGRKINK